jgi:hypothetical protein
MTATGVAAWAGGEPPDDTDDEAPATSHSWRPVDLDPVLAGTYERPQPTVGSRADGVGMFYPARSHTVASESEGGKTWLALDQAAVELRRDNAVIYADFEDDEGGVVGRLIDLGVPPATIRRGFAYLRPDQPIGGFGHYGDLDQALGDLRPKLVVLDGVTEAMTIHGLDPLSNKDAATFGRLVTRWIAQHGPAVVALDHVTKDRENRGRYAIGAVHKLNAVTGAAYTLENRHPFGIGVTGRSGVYLSKDRLGQLRRHALPASESRSWFGDLVLQSHSEHFIEASVEAPVDRGDTFRPTHLMGRVAEALGKAGGPLTVRGVLDRVNGRAEHVRRALAAVVDEGYVTVEQGPRGAQLHRLVRPFEDAEQ